MASVSIPAVAKLMNSYRKRNTGKQGEAQLVGDKPLWSAEQFCDSFNAAAKRAKVEPITLDQAKEFLHSGRDVFSTPQFRVFEQWASIRLGECLTGVVFSPPNETIKMPPMINPPVILPDEAVASDLAPIFKDATNRSQRERMLTAAGSVTGPSMNQPSRGM